MKSFLLWLINAIKSKPGDWADKEPVKVKPASSTGQPGWYDADEEYEKLSTEPVQNPILALHEAIEKGSASIEEAYVMECVLDGNGKLVKDSAKLTESGKHSSYRMKKVAGDSYLQTLKESGERINSHLVNSERLREARLVALSKLREDGFTNDDAFLTPFDKGQYTEYTPIYGGPFFKQLYLTDYLTMHSRCFEAWNHNPIAKRIINLLVQYALGRGFKVSIEDPEIEKKWDAFSQATNLPEKLRVWMREYLIYGELMVDIKSWRAIDPSTVWDIITDPDNLEDVYYYAQFYPTQYQMFTGYNVSGVPGSAQVPMTKYIVRQLPYDQVMHVKGECVSNEKRGRSILFPILGWMKRIKDLYNAEVIGAWLRASFIWDDTIKGSQADVDAHAAKYANMPPPGSVFAHNEAVTRQAMYSGAGGSSSGRGSGGGTSASILAFIATAIGIPKEHFNIMGGSGGGSSRATSLVGSEPFTKVIEELQLKFEHLLHDIARIAIQVDDEDAIEFIFPSVTKDTTTEALGNIQNMEASGYIAQRTAGAMAAAEMNISSYDFDKEQSIMRDDKAAGLDQLGPQPPPPGRNAGGNNPEDGEGGSDIHGQGKVDLQDDMGSL